MSCVDGRGGMSVQCILVWFNVMGQGAAKLYDNLDIPPPKGNSRFETAQSIANGSLATPMPTNDPVELCWGGSYIPRSQCPPHP